MVTPLPTAAVLVTFDGVTLSIFALFAGVEFFVCCTTVGSALRLVVCLGTSSSDSKSLSDSDVNSRSLIDDIESESLIFKQIKSD